MAKPRSSYASRLNADARNEIKRLMRETGVSKSELARLMGVNRVCVTQMFDSNRNLTLHTLERVIGLLGYTVHVCCHEKPKQSRGAQL